MAASGYTPIILFNSGSAGNTPTTGNLAVGELAINYADGKLYYNTGSAIKVLAGSGGAGIAAGSNTQVQYNSSGSLAGSANLTFDGTNLGLAGGTANGVAYLNGSKVLTTGSALTFDGTTFTTTGAGGVVATGVNGVQVNNSGGGAFQSTTGFMFLQSPTASGNGFIFRDTSAGSYAEYMRLTSTGLGIGTSSPSTKLSVTGDSSNLYTGLLYLNDSTASAVGVGGRIGFAGVTGALATVAGLKENATGGDYAGFLQFATRPSGGAMTERMRLDSSGNLGLGVTPSAWGTSAQSYYAIESVAYGNGWLNIAAGAINTVTNAYYNSSGNWIYKTSNPAARYQIVNNTHQWYNSPSGTAGNAISFTQAMTLDNSGNLAIGTTSSTSGYRMTLTNNDADNYSSGIALRNTYASSVYGVIAHNFGGTMTLSADNGNASGGTGDIRFRVGGSERARIDSSGNLLVGTTSASGNPTQGVVTLPNSNAALIGIGHASGTASGSAYMTFNYNGGSGIGSITQSGTTAVLYNTTSDQRLKENIVDAPEFGSVIDSIQVRSYDWKADHTHQRAGFIAQELLTVAPEAVHQPADPEQMMAVDYSKLVPMLVKEIQSLRARLKAANIA